jgi:hypothetical protein
MLVRITAPHFVAGLEYRKSTGVVTNAAPILGWTVGKDIEYVKAWCRKKNYTYEIVKPFKPNENST